MQAMVQFGSVGVREADRKRVLPDEVVGDPVHITQANWERIIRNFGAPVQAFEAAKKIFHRPIYILTKRDHRFLAAARWAFQHPELYIDWCYQKAEERADDPRMVFKSRPPAYHRSAQCQRLLADYMNIEVPPQIEVRGAEEINRFKEWANQPATRRLFEDNIELFKLKICTEFDIKISELHLVVYENSGRLVVGNENLDEIDRLIGRLLKKAGAFYHASDRNRAILSQYQRFASLGYCDKPLYANRTGYSDEEVKAFLRTYRNLFQKPLNRLLLSYYRVKYNSELRFSGKLLGQLGFKPCRHCHNTVQEGVFHRAFADH